MLYVIAILLLIIAITQVFGRETAKGMLGLLGTGLQVVVSLAFILFVWNYLTGGVDGENRLARFGYVRSWEVPNPPATKSQKAHVDTRWLDQFSTVVDRPATAASTDKEANSRPAPPVAPAAQHDPSRVPTLTEFLALPKAEQYRREMIAAGTGHPAWAKPTVEEEAQAYCAKSAASERSKCVAEYVAATK